jgi:hypothetical protein
MITKISKRVADLPVHITHMHRLHHRLCGSFCYVCDPVGSPGKCTTPVGLTQSNLT